MSPQPGRFDTRYAVTGFANSFVRCDSRVDRFGLTDAERTVRLPPPWPFFPTKLADSDGGDADPNC
jgi:hypothetical protein